MLAEDDDEMVSFLKNHLIDVQNTGPNKMPWKFEGAWRINGKILIEILIRWHELINGIHVQSITDPDEIGFNLFDDLPEENELAQKPHKIAQDGCSSTVPEKSVKTPKRKSPLRRRSKQKDVVDSKIETDETAGEMYTGDSDAELFEVEESDAPLIPLYQLRDEGATKWVLLSDLCYLLKVKSKDTLLKLVCN